MKPAGKSQAHAVPVFQVSLEPVLWFRTVHLVLEDCDRRKIPPWVKVTEENSHDSPRYHGQLHNPQMSQFVKKNKTKTKAVDAPPASAHMHGGPQVLSHVPPILERGKVGPRERHDIQDSLGLPEDTRYRPSLAGLLGLSEGKIKHTDFLKFLKFAFT